MIRQAALELTLACNANCRHCGSKAKHPRNDELSFLEFSNVIDRLCHIGCDTITFSGGEPLMRKDWPELAKIVHQKGPFLDLITNGLLIEKQADQIIDADFQTIGVSIDGPAHIHDALRGTPNGFNQIMAGISILKQAGVRVGAVTQINRVNRPHLRDILTILDAANLDGWQLQLTMPHGRAKENWQDLSIPPKDLPKLEDEVAHLIRQSTRMPVVGADNLGYFGRFEPLLRQGLKQKPTVWGGCPAGVEVIGICADGSVKGCLSMPDEHIVGNIRHTPLEEIWNSPNVFQYNRNPETTPLTGHCATCALNRHCRAGCKSAALAACGKVTENPVCIRHQLTVQSLESN